MKHFCDRIGRRDMHDTSGDRKLLRVVEHSVVALDRFPGFGASRWPKSRMLSTKGEAMGIGKKTKLKLTCLVAHLPLQAVQAL